MASGSSIDWPAQRGKQIEGVRGDGSRYRARVERVTVTRKGTYLWVRDDRGSVFTVSTVGVALVMTSVDRFRRSDDAYLAQSHGEFDPDNPAPEWIKGYER